MGTLTENYHIIKELGRGGMGAVYLANDKRLDRMVAIKMLKLNQGFSIEQVSEIIARFQKEARAIAKLSHPNVVGIHDIGEDNDQHYMVMEFLEGKSIGGLLDEEGSLPIELCLNITIQMCKALSYVHQNSIVHRDIKPDNIILTKNEIAKLTDFGIAQNDTDQMRLTQDGAILGSIMYISPEQLRNSKDVDNRADIYSYGVTLYQMLTGTLPFNGDTVGEVVTKILSEQPELPRKLNPNIPFELEAIVLKTINKEREKRYKTMEDLERDVTNLMASHSFKRNPVSTTVSDRPASNTANLNRTGNLTKTGNISTGSLNNQGSSARSTAIIIEKATSGTKLLRTGLKLIFALIIVHLCFNFFADLVTPDIASDIISLPDFQGAMIQGPYSQAYVTGKVGMKATFYCILLVLGMLGITAYTSPIEAKGVHRNFSIGAEILPALVVLIITGLYTFLFVAASDTLKEYKVAFNKDSVSEISNFDDVIKQKGALSYSLIDDYKRKFSSILIKKDKKANVYDEAGLQLKNNIFDGDHIKPGYIPMIKSNDPVTVLIQELMERVFGFNDPVKDLYLPKVNQLANMVSQGTFTSIPDDSTFKVTRDSTNKISNITFEWEKNKLIINPGSVSLNVDETKYTYPPKSDKVVNFKIENDTDKPILLLLYSSRDNSREKDLVIDAKKSEEISVREGKEFQVVVLFKEKQAIPLGDNFIFNNGDLIKVDKVYYETPNYYSLSMKTFPDIKTEEMTKVDLKDKNIFLTKDADILSFKLTQPRKK